MTNSDICFNMTKIVLTGPESTGKTFLAENLAAYFDIPWIPEYARTFLQKQEGKYNYDDLLEIAKGQWVLENDIKTEWVLCDTDLLTIKIWSLEKFGECHEWIKRQLIQKDKVYLLCYPDIEWESDPLRENPNDRKRLFGIYENELQELDVSYYIITGRDSWRLSKGKAIVQAIIN